MCDESSLYEPPLPQFVERAGWFRAQLAVAREADCGVHVRLFICDLAQESRRLFLAGSTIFKM